MKPTLPRSPLPPPAVEHYQVAIVHEYPHDERVSTQGLIYRNGDLYESTGGAASRPFDACSSRPDRSCSAARSRTVSSGRGSPSWADGYDLHSFAPVSRFAYQGDGSGLTADGRRLIMGDGTPRPRFLDPVTFIELGALEVTDRGRLLGDLNELEFVDGHVYANLRDEDSIAIISLDSGQVSGWIDLAIRQGAVARPARWR